MSLDETVLEEVASSGEMQYTKWPALVEPLLERLNSNVRNDFPLPRPYPLVTPDVSTSSETAPQSSTQPNATLVSQTPTTPRTLPPVPPFPGSASSTSNIPNSQPEASQAAPASDHENPSNVELPLLLAQLLASIINTIRTSFSSRPPHTIQRLAELILHPNSHYRTLPSYLRALDRVVSVSSSADVFPLSDQPALVNGVTNGELGGGILWKNDANGHEKARDNELGSDESLGGALLTPIPWLRDIHQGEKEDTDLNGVGADMEADLLEPLAQSDASSLSPDLNAIKTPSESSSDSASAANALASPHHDPLVPERQDGAVTQGELIRMEQEAGVVPVTHSSQSAPLRTAGRVDPVPNSIALGVGVGLEDLEEDDDDELGDHMPHARGPDVVGTVDMGLVGGRDVQVRIGSPPDEGMLERGSAVNPNDAQDVLEGSTSIPSTGTSPHNVVPSITTRQKNAPGDDDSYVDVAKEIGSDEMQVDENTNPSNTESHEKDKTADDEDIVLVDADGATESEREKLDEQGGQVGNDARDTTR